MTGIKFIVRRRPSAGSLRTRGEGKTKEILTEKDQQGDSTTRGKVEG